jgi:hypothetical protein
MIGKNERMKYTAPWPHQQAYGIKCTPSISKYLSYLFFHQFWSFFLLKKINIMKKNQIYT